MKKTLFTLMLLLCATAGWALPDIDDQGYYLVADFYDLRSVIDATKDSNGKSTAKIRLINNIYLNGMESTLCTTFAGEIDGKFTLKNNKGEDVELKYVFFGSTFGDEDTRKKCSYLFTHLDGATIKNVAFCNIRVESEDRDNMGVIASTATSTTFKQITMDRCSVFTDENNAGALVGEAKNCKFHIVFVNSCDVTVDGVRAGGFVGNSENNQYVYGGSSLGTAVFADGNNGKNAGWSGGIAGYSKNDNFFYMANLALVGADQNFVGGYAGESEGSNFYRCQNSGAVLQIDEEDSKPEESFRAIHKKMLEEINKKKSTSTVDAGLDKDTKLLACALNVAGDLDIREILDLPTQPLTRVIGATVIDAMFIGGQTAETLVGTFEVMGTYETEFLTITMGMEGAGASATGAGSMAAACAIGATVAVAIIATAIAIYIFNGDDEVGGICGKATGGFFEQCTNSATLSCRDDNLGGIVGLGIGVTINNCLNTGMIIYDEKVCSGSILGQAKANGSKKCKVTNCYSYTALQVIGSWDIKDGVDDASGNNYRTKSSKDNDPTCDWETVIPILDRANKGWNPAHLGYLLNNGVENRRAGIAPWYHSITSVVNGQYNPWPILDPSYYKITVEDIPWVVRISTADELLDFATKVNSGQQFEVGILTKDIVMPEGKNWTPIGKNESNKHFRGIFDGQGHTISGLVVDNVGNDQGAGLFGAVHTGAIIRNVTVKDSKFTNTGDGGAAGIVGRVHIGWYSGNVLIENCASYANVYVNNHGGGILGRVSTGENNGPSVNVYVENCYNGGNIYVNQSNSGLLCGYTKNHGHILNCWSAGQLRHWTESSSGTCPYSTTNSNNNEPEYLAGYDGKIDIHNCYILNAANIIDDYEEGKMQDSVQIISDTKLTTGEFTYMLNGKTNDVTKKLGWQQNLGTDAYPVPGNKGIYHARKVSNQYGTACLPYALKSDDKISYYTFVEASEGSDIKLKFEPVGEVPPCTPVLFRAAEAKEAASAESPVEICFNSADSTFYKYPNAPLYPTWNFLGTFEQKVFTGEEAKSIYYVSNGVIKNAQKTTIAPYRAYITGPSIDDLKNSVTGQAKSIRFVIEGEDGIITALESVANDLMPVHINSKAYSLMGTEVNSSYRGIVIRNGKKMIQNR